MPDCLAAPQGHAMILGLKPDQVRLFNKHGAWADEFQLEKARLVEIVGPHIMGIQHVENTSIFSAVNLAR